MIKYLTIIFVIVPKVIFSYFKWINRYARHKDKYSIEERYYKTRNLIIWVCKKLKVEFRNHGNEVLPNLDEKFLLVCNHTSLLDPLLIIANSEKPISFVAKKETAKYPFIGKVIKIIDGIFMDRDNIRQEIKCINQASEAIKSNYLSYVIFPEGTRSKNPLSEIGEFKPGAFKIAYKAKSPLVVLAQFGTFRTLKFTTHLKKYPVDLKLVQVYYPTIFKEIQTVDLSQTIHDQIKDVVFALREEQDQYLKLSSKKKAAK